MSMFGIFDDTYETAAKALVEKKKKNKEDKEERYKSAADKYSGKTTREILSDALRTRIGMSEEEFAEAADKLLERSPAVSTTSAAKSFLPVLAEKAEQIFTTPQSGNSSKPIVYSDWAPAANYFGMDQATAYAEHMANTAHQREVADLKAAGLNPVLGISGSGASGVSGSVSSGASSAEKGLSGDALVDLFGATASVITMLVSKNPSLGLAVGKVAQAGGNMLFGD